MFHMQHPFHLKKHYRHGSTFFRTAYLLQAAVTFFQAQYVKALFPFCIFEMPEIRDQGAVISR